MIIIWCRTSCMSLMKERERDVDFKTNELQDSLWQEDVETETRNIFPIHLKERLVNYNEYQPCVSKKGTWGGHEVPVNDVVLLHSYFGGIRVSHSFKSLLMKKKLVTSFVRKDWHTYFHCLSSLKKKVRNDSLYP